MIIIISGTPGTGKTTFAKKIAKEKNLEYIDVKKIIEENNLSEGFDKKRNTKIIDVEKLNKILLKLISEKKNIVIDSHMSHYLPSDVVDICYITKCSLPILKKRLEERNYSEEKIRENLDAEIFDTCRIEALEKGHKIKVVKTDE